MIPTALIFFQHHSTTFDVEYLRRTPRARRHQGANYMKPRGTPQVTKRASFGITRTGYDAFSSPSASQWQKERMSDLHPMEHHGDRLPPYVSLSEFAWLAVIVIAAVVGDGVVVSRLLWLLGERGEG